MLRFHERHAQPGSAPRRRGPALPFTPGLRDWRKDLDNDANELFEATAGDLLDQLGYERTTSRDESHAARIEPIRQTFQTEATAQRHRVPDWPKHQPTAVGNGDSPTNSVPGVIRGSAAERRGPEN
jgi:hypothetical protein